VQNRPEFADADGQRLAIPAAVDRPIDPSVTRQQTRRRLAVGGTVLSLAAVGYLWLPGLLSPSIRRDAIRTAVVERGAVDAAISGTGLVVPAIEQVITSPVDARVVRILERAGATLRAGQPILELDVSQAQLTVASLTQDLAIKANAQAQTRLKLQKSLIDLDGRTEVKALQLASLEAQLQRDRQLAAEGLLSQELLRKSELATAQAAIELKQLKAERDNAHEATRTELAGLALEMTQLRGEEAEARRQLALATPRAGRDGVLTWVVTEEGVAVSKGAALARVADFSSFRVDAGVSDVHAKRLQLGQPVTVRIGEERLDGTIAEINPTVTNGLITVAVALAEPSSPLLRSNLRVDVEIVTARKPQTLRVRRGPFSSGEGTQPVFVVRRGTAERQAVTFGLSGADYFEVTSGLMAGDEVIVSDMRDYLRLTRIRLE
jgi:HlyD family secretion protein